ncbi:MAG: thioredoxin domain-containing protein, partial [Bacteroidota bacterium]
MKRLQTMWLCLMATFMSLSLSAQNAETTASTEGGMVFTQGTFHEALAKAKSENKMLFLDCYTDWCGPCKWMTKNVMTNPEVGDLYNATFVSYKLNMEKGEGPDIAKKYAVKAYPTLLYINGDGQVVERIVGAMAVKPFLEAGQRVKDGLVPIDELEAVYAAGGYDRQWLYEYLMRIGNAGLQNQDAMDEFKKGMVGEAMLEENNWNIFERFFR